MLADRAKLGRLRADDRMTAVAALHMVTPLFSKTCMVCTFFSNARQRSSCAFPMAAWSRFPAVSPGSPRTLSFILI